MPESEKPSSIVERIEEANSPAEVVSAMGSLPLRHIVATPISMGRDLLKIIMNGDAEEAVRASSRYLS